MRDVAVTVTPSRPDLVGPRKKFVTKGDPLKTNRLTYQGEDTAVGARQAPGRATVGRGLVLLALAAGLFAGAAAPASAAAAAAPAHVAAAKPVSVAPFGASIGHAAVHTPAVKAESVGPGPVYSWTLALAASSQTLWTTQATTLTATITGNVGPTVYYIDIWDNQTNTLVGSCTGTATCSFAVTKTAVTEDGFYAYVTEIGQKVAQTAPVLVTWNSATVALSASVHSLPVGSYTTLSTTESANLLQTPYYVQIWDTTTNTRVRECGSDPCSIAVTQSAASTHSYVATLGLESSVNPPADLQSTSAVNYVVWGPSGRSVSLSAPGVTSAEETVTATANVNVSPLYYIEIFDITTGTRIGECQAATCSISFLPPAYTDTDLVAFISDDSTAFLPSGIQAASNTASTTLQYLT